MLLCDFDGTIVETDCTDSILTQFAPSSWESYGKQFDSGAISHNQMNAAFLKLLSSTPEKIKTYLDQHIRIRPGFKELIAHCTTHNIKTLVISTGWDFYILHVLSEFNPVMCSSLYEIENCPGLPVVCSQTSYIQNSYTFSPHALMPQCSLMSPCKGILANTLSEENSLWIVGDSIGDSCMVPFGTHVFAREKLSLWCEKNHIDFINFENFSSILEKLSEQQPSNKYLATA